MTDEANKIKTIEKLCEEINDQIEDYLQQLFGLSLEQTVSIETRINEQLKKIENLLNGVENKNSQVFKKVFNYFDVMKNGYCKAILIRQQDAQELSQKLLKRKSDKNSISYARTAPYLNYIAEILKITDSPDEKSQLYNKIAYFYHKKAELQMQIHHLRSLLSWHFAKENYLDSLKHNPKNLSSVSGYAKCLTSLAKHNLAITFLKSYTNEEEQKQISDFYKVNAVAHRKLYNYNEAKKIVEKDTDREFVQKELKLLENLSMNTSKSRVKSYIEHKNDIIEENYTKRQSTPKYRVLSIDGGGIRGIIPAYLLSEIEKRSHLPISHSFNLLAGTSTGGIISAGLSVPLNKDRFTPQYKAYDILDIYLHQGHRIFQKNFTLLGFNLFSSTYSEKGRYDLFETFFDHKTISQSLTELVIPAADEESLFTTYLFNRHDAWEDPFRNDTYIDALMATSAAPTYFPSHNIEGKGLFNDGGVHVNNPTAVACSEAVRYGVDRHSIQVLSLGTGTYVPNAIKQNSLRGLLFWASHLHEVALEAQVGNTDIAISDTFGKDRYQRWQVWFENPITLDDYGEKNINFLVESANQLIEEYDASEENNINKVVEDILVDKGIY